MINSLQRPDGLPDFDDPPLNEVVLGVQFAPPAEYKQIFAGEVWSLYKSPDYPNIDEKPPLQPQFETFGLPQSQQLSFGLLTGGQHNRYWFLSKGGEELIQFQNDRLLHNWRKVGNETNAYPRFESMILKFEGELRKLEKYVSTLHPQKLNCNQVEVTYINHIVPSPGKDETVSDWFRTVNDAELNAEVLSLSYRRIITDSNNRPCGRLYSEMNPALRRDGIRILSLSITVRGAPATPDIDAALDFIKKGRELIVNEFASITTESAHKRWKRVQ